jgi:1,4-dihydroxy-2-naphthoyl-CoA hydrolase
MPDQPAARSSDRPHPALPFPDMPQSTLHDRMGLVITEASAERVVGTLEVEGNTQPYGLLHGGASCVLAETLASTGAAFHAGPDNIVVGIDINATHHRGVREGTVTGVATPVHLGRRFATYEIAITDDRDRRVCTARLTCAVLPAEA